MPKPTHNTAREPLDIRVLRSLARLGLDSIPVTDCGNGAIKLDLSHTGPNERALAIAIVRSVPGVTDVMH